MNYNQKKVYDALDEIKNSIAVSNAYLWDEEAIAFIIQLKLALFAYGVGRFMFQLDQISKDEPDIWCHLLDELFAKISPADNLMQDCDQLKAYLEQDDVD